MAETYSLAVKGARADGLPTPVKNIKVADSVSGSFGAMQNAMQNGTQFLCQNPDGSQSWYTFDPERSTFANPVLRKV